MKPQELIKSLVKKVGALIDARIRTAEITIKANTDASIKASEERIKSELRAELASKQDISRLEQKLDKTAEDHEERIGHIEEHLGLTNPHKN